MKLWYFFYSHKGGQPVAWDSKIKTDNYYAVTSLPTEGFWWMIREMVREKIVESATIVVESLYSNGHHQYEANFDCLVPPTLYDIIPMIAPGDIVLVRGAGFKHWHDPLTILHERNKNWILFYRANSNRGPWPFWDIILDDLRDRSDFDPFGRLYLKFAKPINPEMFTCTPGQMQYDICIGASYIHDKKGQWRSLEILEKYSERYHQDLKCIMPGAPRHGTHSTPMFANMPAKVDLPGMLTREDMVAVYNTSRMVLYCGTCGQNDRAPLESMVCGCPVIIMNPLPNLLSPWIMQPPNRTGGDIVQHIHYLIHDPPSRESVVALYNRYASKDKIMAQMKDLFTFLKTGRDRRSLRNHKWS